MLRDYQRQSLDSLYDFFEANPHGVPVCCLPVGAGKSWCVAYLLKEIFDGNYPEKALVLSHTKEILVQDAQKLRLAWPAAPLGIYSAGLGQRNMRPITVAGIQSIYRAKHLPDFTTVIIDECHLLSRRSDSMYHKLLNRLRRNVPDLRIVGWSATPFRLDSGMLTEGEDRIFTHIACNISIVELIHQGYLSPFISKHASTQADLSNVRIRGGEYVAEDTQQAFDRDDVVADAVDEMMHYGKDRRSWLVFCAGTKHADHVCAELRGRGIEARTVYDKTPAHERDRLLKDFKEGRIRAIVNVNICCVGFDAPCTDLVAVLRSTQSPGLWIQMVGRGSRLSPETGKTSCVVLDYGSNAERLGPIDAVEPPRRPGSRDAGEARQAPAKMCPRCREVVAVSKRVCPDCEYKFPDPEVKHERIASTRPILSQPVAVKPAPVKPPQEPAETWAVTDMRCSRHKKQGRPDSVKVEFICGFRRVLKFLCFDHGGSATGMAKHFWKQNCKRGSELPTSTNEALERVRDLRRPIAVTVRKGETGYAELERTVFPEGTKVAPRARPSCSEWTKSGTLRFTEKATTAPSTGTS